MLANINLAVYFVCYFIDSILQFIVQEMIDEDLRLPTYLSFLGLYVPGESVELTTSCV